MTQPTKKLLISKKNKTCKICSKFKILNIYQNCNGTLSPKNCAGSIQ